MGVERSQRTRKKAGQMQAGDGGGTRATDGPRATGAAVKAAREGRERDSENEVKSAENDNAAFMKL